MAYDERLAGRLRGLLADEPDYSERKMFGGISFMLGGNMAVGVMDNELLVRLDPADFDAALAKPRARIFDTMRRPARGRLLVGPEAIRTKRSLEAWTKRGMDYARSLHPK